MATSVYTKNKGGWFDSTATSTGITEGITQQRRTQIARQHQVKKLCDYGKRIPRNEPCPCGSGRKFKRCCGAG